MKKTSALVIAFVALNGLLFLFPLLQSRAVQFELDRQPAAKWASSGEQPSSVPLNLGLSRELTQAQPSAARTRGNSAAPLRADFRTDRWRNGWLVLLVALPLLTGVIVGWVASVLRDRPRGQPPRAPGADVELNRRLAESTAQIGERNQRIADLEKALREALNDLRNAPAPDPYENEDLASLQAELATRDEIISGLEETLKENRERWTALEMSESDREERVLRLESELQAASAIIHSLEDDVAEWKSRADEAVATHGEEANLKSATGA